MSTIQIKLGGVDYSVQKPNIGQLRRITKVFNGPTDSVSFDVLGIAMERSEPKCPDIEQIEAGFDEIAAAAGAVLVFSGLRKEEATPGPNGDSRASKTFG